MTARHTPGPWSIGDENNACCDVLLGTEHNLTCSLDRRDDNTYAEVISRAEMLANAQLIAAAPELLDALQIAREFMSIASDWNFHEAEINGEMRSTYDWLEVVDAAIAKATGEPPP